MATVKRSCSRSNSPIEPANDAAPPHHPLLKLGLSGRWSIYRITCTVDGRVYIGRTTDPAKRKKSHWDKSLAECVDEPAAWAAEASAIKAHESTNPTCGYNISTGGRGNPGVPRTAGQLANDELRKEARKQRLASIPRPTAEQRSASSKKAHAALTPEQRAERSRSGWASFTPEQRSERQRRAYATARGRRDSKGGAS